MSYPGRNKRRLPESSDETDNSFVKSVTKKVSGLLPASITKWFTGPGTSNTNGSTATAEATDSSTEDEAPETVITTQPPAKRMRYNSSGGFNYYPRTEITTTTEIIDQCSSYNVIQTSSRPNTYTNETNFRPLNFNKIRSGYEEPTVERVESEATHTPHNFNSPPNVPTLGLSNTTVKRKSLFDSSPNLDITAGITSCSYDDDPNRPRFKPSLLGSPFYPGRIVYGGAASHYINQPNIKQKKPTFVHQSSNNDSTTMSQSARRVMDLLEHYSTPLKEAQRITSCVWPSKNSTLNSSLDTSTASTTSTSSKPLSYKTQELHVPAIASILRLKKRSRLIDTTNAARQIIASHSSASNFPGYPNTPDTQRERNGTDNSKKITTKIKSRLTKPIGRERDEIDHTIIEPVNLPKAVLCIDKDNMPKFTFGASTPKPSAISTPKTSCTKVSETVTSQSIISYTITKPAEVNISKPETVSNSNLYKFSSPVRISAEVPKSSSTLPIFAFGKPDRGIEKSPVDEQKSICSSILGSSKDKEEKAKTKDWQCPDCWVFNKTDIEKCVCCGYKKSEKVKSKSSKCSICKLADKQANKDKCINCDKVPTISVNNLPLLSSQKSSKKKCSECWAENEPNFEKCVCCGGVLSSTSTQELPKLMSNSNNVLKWKCNDCWVDNEEDLEQCVCCGGQHFKKPYAPLSISRKDNDWTCDDCWIKNNSSLENCAACGAFKPGSKRSCTSTLTSDALVSTLFKTPASALSDVIKSQFDKWECSSCLVRNDKDKNKCVCCETDKPGSGKEPEKTSYNFGINTNTTFKFGIDPNTKETITKAQDTKLEESKSKAEESETNNNVLSKTPTFTFGIPAKIETQTSKVNNIPKDNENKTSEPPKLGFTFGIPASSTTTSESSSLFGSANKLSEQTPQNIEENEKPQEVPKVAFKLPISTGDKPLATGVFGSALKTTLSSDKASPMVAPVFNSTVYEEKKQNPSATLILQPSITSEATKSQNNISFSPGGMKTTVNLFAQPASTATSNNITFTSPVQGGSGTSPPMLQRLEPSPPSATLTLFQNNDQQTTPSTSLFQKSESVSTADPPSLASAPMFSFGSSAKPSTSQTEKPKYSFNFGSSNNMNDSNTFKFKSFSTFGEAADNNSTNKFNLSGGNSMGVSNPLNSNPLSSNPLTSNPLTSNPLTSNPLGSGSGLPTGNSLGNSTLSVGSGLPSTNLTVNNKPGNSLLTGNDLNSSETLQAGTPNLFGAPVVPKENIWSSTNNTSANLFASNPAANNISKPAAFTFGSSSPFNSNNSASPAPAFGNNPQPAQNIFGMAAQNTSNPQSLFSTPVKPTQSIFGNPQVTNNPAPTMGLFGTPNVSATPTFGSPNPSIPSFEAPSLTPTPTPTFNFGSQQSTSIFGFGQQQQQQQQQQPPQQPPQALQQPGIYNFGAAQGGAPQVQFNMGSSPNAGVRRVRKAIRRNPQR